MGVHMIHRRHVMIVGLTCVALLVASHGAAADCPNQVGHWPYGSTTAIVHMGTHIVYGAGTVLKVADVSVPSAPTVIAELRLSTVIRDLDISGTVGVVTSFDGGLVILDFSNPSRPVIAAVLEDIERAYKVALDDRMAWVATRSALVAIDLTNPSRPHIVSASNPGNGQYFGISVSGNLAILGNLWNHHIYTVDISDPETPKLLGTMDSGYPAAIAIAKGYAYVADRFTGVQVVDISDPSEPSLVTTVKEGWDYYNGVEVAGTLLLVSHRNYGLLTLDITTPSAPVVLGRLDTAGEATSTTFDNGTTFIADGFKGVTIADLSDPSQPQTLATLPGSGPLWQLATAGNLAAATDVGDLVLFDISNPAAPVWITRYDLNRYIKDVELKGSYAYMVLDNDSLRVADVSDPAHPKEKGTLDIEKGTQLALEGARAVITGDGLLTIADVSDPSQPTELGQLTLDYSREPSSVLLAGAVAYLSEAGTGLHIIDLSDPAHPSEAGLIEMTRASHAGAIRGSFLFVSDQGRGIRIFDISDPLQPREVSLLRSSSYTSGLDVKDGRLAVATNNRSIFIADVSDPANPAILGTSPMVASAEGDAAFAGGFFVVTEGDGGLEIFDLAGCAIEPPEASFTWTPKIPEAGHAARFTDTSGGTITSWHWDFGNGSSSSEQSPLRAFPRPGSFPVTLTVTGPLGSDSFTKVITVSEGSSETPPISSDPGWRGLITAAAHVGGLHGTSWVTDVVLHNPGTVDTVAHLYFMERDHDNSATLGWAIHVNAGTSVELDDIVAELFGKSDTAGAILVSSQRELVISSRTYNDAPSGTFGQYIPGLSLEQAIARSRLIQLTRSSAFRTNIGVANPEGQALVCKIRLFDAGGTPLGNELSVSLKPWGWRQLTNIFPSDVEDGFAELTVETPGGKLFAYASVVDNVTGDPVFVREAPAATDLWIPAAAHVSGYQGTRWRTDLELFNGAGSNATITISLLQADTANTAPTSVKVSLPAGTSVRLEDILDEPFEYSGAGALHLTTDQGDAVVTSRTFNQTAHGTYGQYIPGVTGASAVTGSGTARLVQLHQSAGDTTGSRTNIGVLNTTESSIDVSIALHASTGDLLGTVPLSLAALEYRQVNRIFREVTSSAVENGYAVLSTSTGGGSFIAYASVIDNASGDPIYILAR